MKKKWGRQLVRGEREASIVNKFDCACFLLNPSLVAHQLRGAVDPPERAG